MGLPAGVTCAFSPTSVTPASNGTATSQLTISVAANVSAGDYSFQVVGVGGGTSKTNTLGLTVTPAPRYSVGGRVTDGAGSGLGGVTLSLTGSQSATAQTDTNGNYSLNGLASGGNYSLSASLPGYTFTPSSRSYTNLSSNQTAQDFTDVSVAGLQYYPLAHPVRLLDTRPGESACYTPGAPLAANSVRLQPARGACAGSVVPASALAIQGNATAVNPSAAGYIILYPSGAAQPVVANLNYLRGQVIPNAFTVTVGSDGAFQIYTPSQTHFIVDLAGYFAP